MNIALMAGSLAGVLLLAFIARALGLGGAALADEAEACAIAEAEMPGFIAAAATLDGDRAGALVTGVDGRALRVRRHGAQFVAESVNG
ncbi:hypothetical protein GVO57_01325 [Sphingomonas changnyeongensis]|uniref:Uncharacterized protein n=1 Tax=Sphingomonas changnyeongensis TaxID=2698679 RepID=A0A7Z2S4W4_9SPHN|nr:hypothetical protein [Sphingomonas changnyeongensis]QHL89713.1 hypothetical protein GVO57_01325 [Sphingomonas changnyeongensis]